MIKGKFERTHIIQDAEHMLEFGQEVSKHLQKGNVVYLHGDLGAGKTTLAKGIIQGFGFTGSVKSPTYTLVETYALKGLLLQHFDLYRLSDPQELEWIGIRDYFTQETISVIEWPQKGSGFLPLPSKEIYIEYAKQGRSLKIKDYTSNDKR